MKIISHTHANRGMELERIIDTTNGYMRSNDIADIRKIPTPVKVMSNVKGRITGYPSQGEWVDYAGIWKGKAILFDAKQTKGKSLPLHNLHMHQYEILKSWHYKGAVSFLIVYFSDYDKYYYLPFKALETFVNRENEGGRKSIALAEFQKFGIEIEYKNGILNYLQEV